MALTSLRKWSKVICLERSRYILNNRFPNYALFILTGYKNNGNRKKEKNMTNFDYLLKTIENADKNPVIADNLYR
jgi:hypothetical protein